MRKVMTTNGRNFLMRMMSLSFVYIVVSLGCAIKPTQVQKEGAELTAVEIMQKAHQRAGGDFWVRPQSLTMKGYGLFYQNGQVHKNEIHNMWRVYESRKEQAHTANGKVRIESFRNGKAIFIITYDGENTYDLSGKQNKSEADKRWASNFGYGVIRHAFDKGYKLTLMGEGKIKAQATYRIKITDPEGGETLFDINRKDFSIVGVAFDTPRGWHERHYSNFFSKEKYSWQQPGLVELYYEGKKANDIIWEDFEINENLPDSLFMLTY